MSSTRNNIAQRMEFGNYCVTPLDVVADFLDVWKDAVDFNSFRTILDPCAGGLEQNAVSVQMRKAFRRPGTPMSYPEVLIHHCQFKNRIITNDFRKDSPARFHFDYLKWALPRTPDLIITNPPFFFAQEVWKKAWYDVRPLGYVVLLLRLNFLGSKKRLKIWRHHMPESIYVHSRRMSFWPDGGSDSIEYAHFVWRKQPTKSFAKLYVIP